MKYDICSISFRHEMVSFQELVHYAQRTGFSGIELWGVHAFSMLGQQSGAMDRTIKELDAAGIRVSMISDYIDLAADAAGYLEAKKKWLQLIAAAKMFKCDKIRIFAGNSGSGAASSSEWNRCVELLHQLAEISSAYGIYLVIETHPNTYADRLDSAIRLMTEVNHAFVRINLDFLHLWETGTPPVEALQALKPWTIHYHLKNILNAGDLWVFLPDNVYSPKGRREGMSALSQGVVDYSEVIRILSREDHEYSASLEWFGAKPFSFLESELAWLHQFGEVFQ